MRNGFNLFLFLLIWVFTISQLRAINSDSLNLVISNIYDPLQRADKLNELGIANFKTDMAVASAYLTRALNISEDLAYPSGSAKALLYLGIISFKKNNLADCIELTGNSAVKFNLASDTTNEALANLQMGIYFYKHSMFEKSAISYLKAQALYEKLSDDAKLGSCLNNIGLIYYQLKQYSKAKKSWEKGLELVEGSGNKKYIISLMMNLGLASLKQGYLGNATEFQTRALKLSVETNDINNEAKVKNNLGAIYRAQNDFHKAKYHFQQSLMTAGKISVRELSSNDRFSVDHWSQMTIMLQNYQDLAEVYLEEKNYPQAITMAKKGEKLAIDIDNAPQLRDCYKYLSKAYEFLGQPSRSLYYYKKYTGIKDSVFSNESTQLLTQAELEFGFNKEIELREVERQKEKAISAEKLKREKLQKYAFGLFVILALILAGLIFMRFREKKKANIKLGEKNLIILKEMNRSEELLHNILPIKTARELKEVGKVKARYYKNVSVGFTDFGDFTRISIILDPEKLVELIHYCFSEFDKIIEEFGLEKIKTIGDSYMYGSGLPEPDEENAVKAVKAALAIRDRMSEIYQEKKEKGEECFEIRIGVNSGPVVAGVVGLKKFAYDIWGDTVNTASRIESNGFIGKVNISSATWHQVKDYFLCEYRGKLEVKGKGALDMYFVDWKETG